MVISHLQVLTGMILQAFQLQSMLVSGYIVLFFFLGGSFHFHKSGIGHGLEGC